jgi:hypothetical protein
MTKLRPPGQVVGRGLIAHHTSVAMGFLSVIRSHDLQQSTHNSDGAGNLFHVVESEFLFLANVQE